MVFWISPCCSSGRLWCIRNRSRLHGDRRGPYAVFQILVDLHCEEVSLVPGYHVLAFKGVRPAGPGPSQMFLLSWTIFTPAGAIDLKSGHLLHPAPASDCLSSPTHRASVPGSIQLLQRRHVKDRLALSSVTLYIPTSCVVLFHPAVMFCKVLMSSDLAMGCLGEIQG